MKIKMSKIDYELLVYVLEDWLEEEIMEQGRPLEVKALLERVKRKRSKKEGNR